MISSSMIALGKKRSCIRELFEYGVRQAEVVGKENIYDFSIGNPSVPAPEETSVTIQGLLHGDSLALHGYTPASGCMDARVAVAADLAKRSHDSIRPENVFFTCGAAPAIVATVRALAVEDAEFMVLAPYFAEYPMYITSNGGKMVVVPPDTDSFQIHVDWVEERLTPHTQAIVVNSPNNPSGVVYSAETLKKLAEVLTRKSREFGHPIYIIADEPYRELVYDGADTVYIPTIYPNTVICYSYSKSLSMPGERIGYACVPDSAADSADLFAAIAGAARTIGHVCAPSMMQKVIALNTVLRPKVELYDKNRKTLYSALTDMGYECVKPQGAFYMMVKALGGDSKAFSERAKRENLLIVPTDDFGCPGYVRLSTCVSPDMIERSLPVFRKLIENS
ncbi:MAG: pyridoxal phosphate-dependent aminotransferase [Oscillospiraceae bacterium]|nr:pyridoxal phosphate-dependent aminotransferase [Oscillospiraceae bacterium]